MAKGKDHKRKLDGYTLRLRLRRARKHHTFTATEQAVYQELSDLCNDKEWPEVFQCTNDEIYGPLNISENTLVKARNVLIENGLIYYQPNKSKRAHSSYSFVKAFPSPEASTSNSEVDSPPTSTSASPQLSTSASTSEFEVHTNNKEETKTETETSGTSVPGTAAADAGNSDSGIVPEQPGPGKKKKSSAQKKKDEDVTPHWQALAARWIAFYVDKFKIEPTFWDAGAGESRAALALIMKRLKKQTELAAHTKDQEWTEEYALRVLTHFLIKAYGDKWRAENFRLTILSSHYDSIVNPNGKQQSNSKTGPDGVLNADHKRDLAERLAKATGQSGA